MLEGVRRCEAVISFLLMIKIDFLLTPLLNRDLIFSLEPKEDAV